MNSLRFPRHLVLELRRSGHTTHFSRPLFTPDGTPVPATSTPIPHPDGVTQTFDLPGGALTLRPRIKPGAAICVKERWRVGAWTDGHIAVDYAADRSARAEWLPVREPFLSQLIRESREDLTRAGHVPDDTGRYTWEFGKAPTRWRRPETMRISLSRAAARPVQVRPVRLSELTNTDGLNAGMLSVSEGWLQEHFPAWCTEFRRVNRSNAARLPTTEPGQLTAPPVGPTPLDRLQAAIRHGHNLHADQDVWVWATELHLLDQTPLQIYQAAQASA